MRGGRASVIGASLGLLALVIGAGADELRTGQKAAAANDDELREGQKAAAANDDAVVHEVRFRRGTDRLAGSLYCPPGAGAHSAIVMVLGSGPVDRN
jgi:hypothetical protein